MTTLYINKCRVYLIELRAFPDDLLDPLDVQHLFRLVHVPGGQLVFRLGDHGSGQLTALDLGDGRGNSKRASPMRERNVLLRYLDKRILTRRHSFCVGVNTVLLRYRMRDSAADVVLLKP